MIDNSLSCRPIKGDIDGSGIVDSFDLSRVVLKFGQSVPSGTPEDLDDSGKVNSLDLSILLSNIK